MAAEPDSAATDSQAASDGWSGVRGVMEDVDEQKVLFAALDSF
jgi:hypothetical protein